MSFLSPLLLLGMALVSVPVIVHLINRKRATKRPFPPIEFLLRSKKRLAKKLKLKQLLLLLFRVLLFLLLPLAMAQPYLLSDAGETDDERLPTATVLVLDDSVSMGHRQDGQSSFEVARDSLLQVLDELRPWDQVALVLAHSPADAPFPELLDDHNQVRQFVEQMERPTNLPGNLPAALALAQEIQATGQLPGRRTIVFTDNVEHAWLDTDEQMESLAALGAPEIVVSRSGDDLSNAAILDAGFEVSIEGGDSDIDIWALVGNFSEQPRSDIRADLVVDGDLVGSTLVELEPRQTHRIVFTVDVETRGFHLAEISLALSGPDLEIDNQHFVSIHLNREVQALLVDGDPRNVSYRDELFYLERALYTGPDDPSGIVPTVTVADSIDGDFDDYDVIVLANVETLGRARIGELTRFVREGGGVLFTMGSLVDPETYNNLFGELLPKPLRSLRELCEPQDPDAELLATRIARLETTHPVFRVFDLPGGESIQSVSVYRYMLLEPSSTGQAQTLVSYGDGGPALVERDFGAGRVALFTTTIDRDWTDLPIRTAFLPMMRRLIRHLARRGATDSHTEAMVGLPVAIDIEAQNPERVQITGPNDDRYIAIPEPPHEHVVEHTPDQPGHYRVALDIAGSFHQFEELMFSANIDSSEADLIPLSSDLPDEVAALYTNETDSGDSMGTYVPERRVALWPPLLLGALLALYVESSLAVRRRVWGRLRNGVSAMVRRS